jgi:ribosome-associated translation inhibitor RaiA
MNIIISNDAQIPNKFIRYIKWRVHRLKEKFGHLLYAEIFIRKEGSRISTYTSTIRLGVGGHDIVITNKSNQLNKLWKKSLSDASRYLRKNKERNQ